MKTREVFLGEKKIGEIKSSGDDEADVLAARDMLHGLGLIKVPSQLQRIFFQAQSFGQLARSIYNTHLSSTSVNDAIVAPFVVNCAFGIELYLKTIALAYGDRLRGHKLVKLYDRLPTAAKTDIALQIPSCANTRGFSKAPDYRACLVKLNDVFVEWRYIYEKQKSDMIAFHELIFVLDVLHETCRLTPSVNRQLV